MRHVRPATAFAVATGGIALFSCMDAVMKGLTLAIGVYNAMLWRSLAGTLIAGAIHFARGPRPPSRRTLRLHVERGVVSTAMGLLFFWGLARVPMAQTVALTFIAPLIAIFFAAVLLEEQVTKRAVGGSIAAFAGVLLVLAGQAQGRLGPDALIGAAAILTSAVLYAYNIILMRRQALVADAMEIACFQNGVVSLVLLLAAPALLVVPDSGHAPMLILAAFLATGSLLLLSWAYARAEAYYLAPVEYTAFLWASLLGWLVFDEHVLWPTVAGAVLIVVACLYAARRPAPPLANLEPVA